MKLLISLILVVCIGGCLSSDLASSRTIEEKRWQLEIDVGENTGFLRIDFYDSLNDNLLYSVSEIDFKESLKEVEFFSLSTRYTATIRVKSSHMKNITICYKIIIFLFAYL